MSDMFSAIPERGGSNGEDSFEIDTTSTLVNDDSDRTSVDGLVKKISTAPLSPRQMRRLSIPDMHMLKKAIDLRESVGDVEIPFGKLQVDLLNMRTDVHVRRPVMRLRVGAQHYYSRRSKSPTGDWNEGFVFIISYHSQLFDTLEFDLYDQPKKWGRKKSKHVAKAKLKISRLNGRPDMFLTFLPLYEYHARRTLPNNVKVPQNFKRLQVSKVSTELAEDAAPEQYMHKRILNGNIYVRVRYIFQHPKEETDETTPVYMAFDKSDGTIVEPESPIEEEEEEEPIPGGGPQPVHPKNLSDYSKRTSQHGRPDLAQSEKVVQQVFNRNLSSALRDVPVPEKALEDHAKASLKETPPESPSETSSESPSESALDSPETPVPTLRSSKPTKSWLWSATEQAGQSATAIPAAINGLMYGFSQRDTDKSRNVIPKRTDTDTTESSSSDGISIQSVGFGDKVFAFRWMNQSFEEIAVSHPTFDKMIGLVVSAETRALVRGVLKLASAFGQGFKVTTFQLLTAMSILEKFYAERPVRPPTPVIEDLHLIEEARHYFQHAIVAYGWRGLYYLGEYGKYLRAVQRSKSNREAIVKFLRIPAQDLLGYEYGVRKGAVFQPSYFVSVDRPRRAIILGIRGTWSLYDCITDLVCEYRPWKGGLAHSGMLASAQWFFTNIIPQIFHYVHNHAGQIDSFIITGHSLGGGSASLLTMMVVDHIQELRHLSGNPNFRVHCYSYAPVAAVTEALSDAYAEYIDSFVCQDDIVGRTSYGTAMELKELIMNALAAVEAVGGVHEVNNNADARKACFDAIETCRIQIYQGEKPEFPLLHIPGRTWEFRRSHAKVHKYFRPIMAAASSSFSGASLVPPLPSVRPHHIKRSDTQSEPMLFSVLTPTEESEITYTMHEGSAQLSEEMLITRTCIEDHMMVTYMKALQQVWENCVRKHREVHLDVPTPAPSASKEHAHAAQTNVPDRPPASTASNFDPLVLPTRSKTCLPDMQHVPWSQADNASDPYQHEQQHQHPSWFSRWFTKPAR